MYLYISLYLNLCILDLPKQQILIGLSQEYEKHREMWETYDYIFPPLSKTYKVRH